MKPILTRAEVEEMLFRNESSHPAIKGHGQKTLNTITEAVELLREWMTARYDGHYPATTENKTQAFLARYEGKEPTQENAK